MTPITKKFAGVLALALLLFVTGAVSAQERPAPPTKDVAFCQRVKSNTGNEAALISELETIAQESMQNTNQRLQARRNEQVTLIDEVRNNANYDFRANIRSLLAKAKTPEQQQAVRNFEARVNAATTKRNVAVDGTQEAFRTEFTRIVRERQDKMTQAVKDFRSSYSALFKKAVSDCSSSATAASARTNFFTNAKIARDVLVTNLSPSQSIADTKPLALSRNAKIKQLNTDYVAEIEAAKTSLRQVMQFN